MAGYINEKILTDFVIDYMPRDEVFIADEILTKVPVNEVSGKYIQFLKREIKLSNDIVGYRSSSPELQTKRIPIKGAYTTEKHAHKDFITEEDAKAYFDYMDLVKETSFELKTQLIRNKEKRVSDLVISTSNYTSSISPKWDDTSPKIMSDIQSGITQFTENCGISPNTLIIPRQVWDVMKFDEEVLKFWVRLTGLQSKTEFSLTGLLNLAFDTITKILIPNAKYDKEPKGKTESLEYIWGDNVALLYTVPKGTKKTFTWASRFVKQEIQATVYPNYDPDVKGDWVKVSCEEDIKEVCSNAIYLLKGVLK